MLLEYLYGRIVPIFLNRSKKPLLVYPHIFTIILFFSLFGFCARFLFPLLVLLILSFFFPPRSSPFTTQSFHSRESSRNMPTRGLHATALSQHPFPFILYQTVKKEGEGQIKKKGTKETFFLSRSDNCETLFLGEVGRGGN